MSRLSSRQHGAWVPWPAVERAVRLKLRPASRWQVFVLLLCTSCRFGCREAWLSVKEIATETGLSERTVKSCIADLIAAGLVRRAGRYRKLAVTIVTPPVPRPGIPEITEVSLPHTAADHRGGNGNPPARGRSL